VRSEPLPYPWRYRLGIEVAIVVGAALSLIVLSPLSALIVAVYGGCIAALSIAIERIPCKLPHILSLP
jgi:hypothetical protein